MTTRITLPEVLTFMNMLHSFQGVARVVHVPGEDRYENDIEHSYILAMTVWYAIDTFKLPYSRDKAIQYALVHDLPEVHAGDTYIYSKDQAQLDSKKQRETDARAQLVKDFPTVPAMHEAMEAYEQQTEREAVFVRALDKLMPVITIYIGGGRTWHEQGVTFTQAQTTKRASTANSPEVADLTEQLLDLLNKSKETLFTAES